MYLVKSLMYILKSIGMLLVNALLKGLIDNIKTSKIQQI